jgi:hypothetical protein
MVASVKSTGRMAVVVPHGVLFRGGTEGAIRKGLLEDDLVEAVVGLGSNLFYGTGIPAAVLFLDRNKPAARKGKVLRGAAAGPSGGTLRMVGTGSVPVPRPRPSGSKSRPPSPSDETGNLKSLAASLTSKRTSSSAQAR